MKSLTPSESAAKAVIPDVAVTKIPVADGGEGTVDALVAAMNGTKVRVPAHDPLGRLSQPNMDFCRMGAL